MRRLVLILITSQLSGQTVDTRIRELSRVLPQSHAARPLADGMDEARAALQQLESRPDAAEVPATLRDQRRKLALLDEAYQAEFSRIESTLRGAGLGGKDLEQKLALWHDFRAHYRRRMDASLSALDRLGRAASPSRQDLASLRATLGSPAGASTGATANYAPSLSSPPPLPQTKAVITAASEDAPTGDDLAETTIVQLSPDIRALAASYGNSPSALFAYVYNNIRFEPYRLLMQNSEGVLWSRRGSDADQATLLIALLRAAGVPARYVTANIDIPVADAVNWVGAKDKAGASALLTPATTLTDLGDHFRIMDMWVEAWIDQGSGPRWISMTPSLKSRRSSPACRFRSQASTGRNF